MVNRIDRIMYYVTIGIVMLTIVVVLLVGGARAMGCYA